MSGTSLAWYQQLKLGPSTPSTHQNFFCGYPQILKFLTGIPLQEVSALSKLSVIECARLMLKKAAGKFMLLSETEMGLIMSLKSLEARNVRRNLLWLFSVSPL